MSSPQPSPTRPAPRRRPRPLARVAPVLLLAACHAEPRRSVEPELVLPEAWLAPGASAEAPATDAWWSAFEAPGLSAAVDEALANNRDLTVAAARVAAAAAQARVAGADRLPSVAATLDRTRAQNVFVGLPIPGDEVPRSLATTWRAALEVSWELDLWGRLAAGRDAAAADLAAAERDAAAARHAIAARTARAWLAWHEAGLQERLAVERAASFERTAELVRDRYARGTARPVDVRLAEANAARAAADIAARREARERAYRGLEALLGRTPRPEPRIPGAGEGGAVETDDLLTLLPTPPPPAPVGLPADLLERRPDLAAAAARVHAADRRADAARAALLPALRLTGSAGRTSDEVGDLLDGDFDIWSLGAGLTQPIFQGGRLRAAADRDEARAVEALAAFEGAVLVALGEVETALASEAALADLEADLAVAEETARGATTLAEDSYSAGSASVLEVLDARRGLLDARAQRLTARRRLLDARIDLHLALGGGFGPEAE